MSLEGKIESLEGQVEKLSNQLQFIGEFIQKNMIPKTSKTVIATVFADLIQKDPSTIRRWINKGTLKEEARKYGYIIENHYKERSSYLIKFKEA